MPIVNGNMYPEGRPILHKFNVLNILILGDITHDLAVFIGHLGLDIEINLHCTGVVVNILAEQLCVERHEIAVVSNEDLLTTVGDLDIDIVLDQNDEFNQDFLWSKFYEFDACKTITDLQSSVENYLVGNGVAWSFAMPVWNMPLSMKYVSVPGLCMDYFSFMGECSTKGYTSDQKERVRYVTNKIKQIEYARDVLQYYIKRMRKARRAGMSDDDYNIQLNYHLSNYYFLMAGALDSLARLINSVHKLGLTRYGDLAVEKDNFLARNRTKRTGFVRMFKEMKFKKWILFLKERRNFIAHDGDMRQTPLVEENSVPLTDAEVDAIVGQQLDWVFLATVLPAEMLQAQREQAVQLVRIQNDYKVIAEKVMLIPTAGGHKMHYPLIDIDHDYEQFSEIMSKVLVRLRK